MVKHFIILLSLILLTTCFVACNKKEEVVTEGGGKVISKTENKMTSDKYNAKVYYDGDHYVLNVFTDMPEDEFSFSYNPKKFLLDSTGSAFENTKVEEDESSRTYTIKLEANTLYEFSFIKLGNEKLVLGENLIIK